MEKCFMNKSRLVKVSRSNSDLTLLHEYWPREAALILINDIPGPDVIFFMSVKTIKILGVYP